MTEVPGAVEVRVEGTARPSSAGEPEPGLSVNERVRLLRDGLINNWGVLVVAIVGLAVVPVMLDGLGLERYGLWVALLAAVALIGEIDFGLGTIMTREVAADPGWHSVQTSRVVSSAATAYLVLGLAGGLLITVVGFGIGYGSELAATGRDETLLVFAMGGVLSLAGRGLAFSTALLYGWRCFGVANAAMAALAVLSGTGTVLILAGGGELGAVAGWQAASTALTAAAVYAITARLRKRRATRGRPSWRALRPQLAFGISSQLLTLSVNLPWVAVPGLVGAISGTRLVASYDVGRRFPSVLSSLSWRSSEAFFPAASRESRVGNSMRQQAVLDANMRWNLVFVLPFSILLWILAPDLLAVWLETPPPHSATILRLLVGAVAVDALGAGCLHVLWAAARMRPLLRILTVTTAAGLGLAALLLSYMGVRGAAIGLLVMTASRTALLLRRASRDHRVLLGVLLRNLSRGLLLPLLACAGATLAGAELIEPRGWPGLFGVCLGGLVAYLLPLSLGWSRQEEQAILLSAARAPASAARRLSRKLRVVLRRIAPLRSAWYLGLELARMSGPASRPTAAHFDREFEAKIDPWDYRREAEQERHLAATLMLDSVRDPVPLERAVEIGCAEGMFTELLAPRCRELLAVDLSSVALDRARTRCDARDNVTFQKWDLLRDEDLGSFDLVVAMDVLDYLLRPGDLRHARNRIRSMLRQGGYLLVSTFKQSEVYETAWWRWRIPRGRMINASLEAMGGLRTVETRTSEAHTLTLYVRAEG